MKSKTNPSILLVANFSNNTGYAWNRIYKLYNSIAKAFLEKEISVCVSFSTLHPPVSIFESQIPFTPVEWDIHDKSMINLFRLSSILKNENVRYIYFTDQPNFSFMYFLARLSGVRTIVTHLRLGGRDPDPIVGVVGWKRMGKLIMNQFTHFTPDKIYVPSNYVAQYITLIGCYSNNQVRIIYNGVISDGFCGNVQAPLNNHHIKIACCSRASLEKGIGVLIESVGILKHHHKFTNFCVYYAGDGPDMAYFRDLAQKLDIDDVFYFLGALNDASKLICESNIVVIPSICGEAFSNVAAESMAAGKALVTTDAGALPEVVGDCATVVAHSDAVALASALHVLAKDKARREDMGMKGKIRAREHYEEKDYHRNVSDSLIKDLIEY